VTQLVVGAGEVGTAVHAVLGRAHHTAIRDVEPVDVHAEVLHVCFPWSARFVETVQQYEAEHGTGLTVVHSTVPVGVCDPEGWVHSPVRGRHPDLLDSLLTFVKHFGGGRADEAAKLFEAAGCEVMVHDRAAETEAGKLAELCSYGLSIVFEKAIHGWCAEHGLNFATVYTAFRETYNDGYIAMGHPKFVQPVLEHMPGPIGGHCIVPSMALLDHPLAELVVEASRAAA
jgi:hypothetical protein